MSNIRLLDTLLKRMDARPATITRQMPAASGPERCVLLSDRSASMDADDYPPTRLTAGFDAALEYLFARQALVSPDLISVVLFDTDAEVVCADVGLSDAVSVVSRLKAKHPIGSGTDINAGLLAAERLFRREMANYRHHIVLLTDGQGGDPIRTARRLHDAGVLIDVIGIAGRPQDVAESEMRKVASTIDGLNHYRYIGNKAELLKHFKSIATGLMRVQ